MYEILDAGHFQLLSGFGIARNNNRGLPSQRL